jgi:hypothetical protein
MQYEDIIDDYLLGRMSSEEEQNFLQECKTNPILKEEAISMAYLVKGLKNK